MRHVRYHSYGGPEVLEIEEVDVPEPGPGQALIRTEAIGANFVDTKFRSGTGGIFQQQLPATVTGDVVGTVTALGEGVDGIAVGDRVATLARDAFADFVVDDAAWLAPVPDNVDVGLASMLPMGAPVALRVLRMGQLTEGETVLVTAASGGIGHLAIQLARLLGAGTVVAAASSPAKLDFAKEYGADVVVDYSSPDWVDQVRSAVPGGVDVAVDSLGGDVFHQTLGLLAPFGRLIAYGAASGDLPSISVSDVFRLTYVAGFSLLAWRDARPDQAHAEMGEIAEYARSGRLRTSVHATLPLTEAAEAHRLLESRQHLGRVLLVP